MTLARRIRKFPYARHLALALCLAVLAAGMAFFDGDAGSAGLADMSKAAPVKPLAVETAFINKPLFKELEVISQAADTVINRPQAKQLDFILPADAPVINGPQAKELDFILPSGAPGGNAPLAKQLDFSQAPIDPLFHDGSETGQVAGYIDYGLEALLIQPV